MTRELDAQCKFPIAKQKVLLVGDEDRHRDELCAALKQHGYEVTAVTGDYVAHHLTSIQADLVVTEIVMRDQEGLELISKLRTANQELPIVALAGGERAGSYLSMARLLGATATLSKPFSAEDLLRLSLGRQQSGLPQPTAVRQGITPGKRASKRDQDELNNDDRR